MKCSIFLLSLIGALALADGTCQCDEPPVCIQSYPESCICAERAKEACWNKCGGPMPELTGCPPLTAPVPEPEPQPQPRADDSTLVSSTAPGCLPEPLLCEILHGPRTCECRNAIALNKMKCTKIWLPLEDCSAPETQPQPQARDTEPAVDTSLDSACIRGPLLCETLYGPRTCECRNAIALNKMRCTKIWLPLEDCSAPPTQPGDDTCECEQTMCIQSWPESCFCENAAKEACYQKCGGESPELETCPSLPSQTFATVVMASSSLQTSGTA